MTLFLPPPSMEHVHQDPKVERVEEKGSETQICAASDDTKDLEDSIVCGEGKIVDSSQSFDYLWVLFMSFFH